MAGTREIKGKGKMSTFYLKNEPIPPKPTKEYKEVE